MIEQKPGVDPNLLFTLSWRDVDVVGKGGLLYRTLSVVPLTKWVLGFKDNAPLEAPMVTLLLKNYDILC